MEAGSYRRMLVLACDWTLWRAAVSRFTSLLSGAAWA